MAVATSTALLIAGGAALAAGATTAGVGIYNAQQAKEAAHDQARAQRDAAAKSMRAQMEAQRDAQARTAKQAQQRNFSADSTNVKLRGIQATMLASRKALNSDGVGKSKLGE